MNERKIFALLAKDINCNDEVMALGYLMRDWLQSAIVDSETNVDQGAGLGSFDLWATVGGKNVFINIRLANKS